MLETEIKLLRKAIEANTAALLARQSLACELTETVEEEPVKEELVKEEPKGSEKVTSQIVKNLAKSKMSEGVPRTTIKAIITKLGAESIADLDEDGLVSLYEKLQEL